MPRAVTSKSYLVDVSLQRTKVPSFDEYPFSIPAIKSMKTLALHPKATFFVGENGSGKSTIIEAIAVGLGLNPEGGSRNFRFGTRESHSSLSSVLRLSRTHRRPKDMYFLRTESFFNVATEIERLDVGSYYGSRSLHEQSHGESFFTLFNERFYGKGLYLLDEPEAALSPTRQLAFLSRMHQLIQADSQFIISTHSPILLGYPEATIYQLSADGMKKVAYQETEHYAVTKEFLNRTDRMLEVLLGEK